MSRVLRRPETRAQWCAHCLGVVASLAAAVGSWLAVPGADAGGSLIGTGVSTASIKPDLPARSGVTSRDEASTTPAFMISGNASGIFPGATILLHLLVTNNEPFAITVTSMTTTVSDTSTHCSAAYVWVTSFTGRLNVASKGKVHATVHLLMAHSAPNGCQRVVFVLHYRGRATRP